MINQDGLVSFVVVIFIMIVLSLILMSYSKIVRREQIQTLDRQLGVQALYAAESGVNDAIKAINADPSLLTYNYDKCNGAGSFTDRAGLTTTQSLGDGVSYSCLLIDSAPMELDFPAVNTQQAITTAIQSKNNANISSIEISWDSDSTGSTNISGCTGAAGNFPANLSSSCQIGVLRFEFVPFMGTVTRSNLINDRAIGFLQPSNNGSSSRSLNQFSGLSNQGYSSLVKCDGSGARYCTLTLTNINLNKAYIRLRSIYRNAPVTIRAYNGSNRVALVGSQVMVDSTGIASGVIKRIQQRRQVNSTKDLGVASDFAIQTKKTICKRFLFRPNYISPSLDGVDSGSNDSDYCDPLNN